MHTTLSLRLGAFAAVIALAAACSTSRDTGRTDTAAGSVASGSTTSNQGTGSMQGDSSMASMSGMQGDSMAGMSGMSNMTGDADRDFLRMMSDHHKGLIAMAHEATKQGGTEAKKFATTADAKQDKELEQMTTMLQRDFKDSYDPKIIPQNKQMADDLKSKSGTEFDRTFFQNTITHHQQAIKMINDYLPKGKSAQIKQMAEKMKADQTKEIGEIQQKLNNLKG